LQSLTLKHKANITNQDVYLGKKRKAEKAKKASKKKKKRRGDSDLSEPEPEEEPEEISLKQRTSSRKSRKVLVSS
jgi:hypothetical protein